MKIQLKHILAVALAVPVLSSCLDEEYPTNGMTKSQVEGSTTALEALNMGVVAQMLNMGTGYGAAGFVGQMVELDAMTGQIPPAATGYDYFSIFTWSYLYLLLRYVEALYRHHQEGQHGVGGWQRHQEVD